MIKLIAADLDGTLLDSNHQISPRLPALILQLKELGIHFIPASGRQYYSVLRLFPQLENELLFISENGGMVMQRGDCLFFDEIPTEHLEAPLQIVQRNPHAHILFSGEHTAYYQDDDPVFLSNAAEYYARLQKVPCLMEAAAKEPICKIAVFEKDNAEHGCYPQLLPCNDRLQVVLSGRNWVDMMNPGTSKGTAMRAVQDKLGITPDACMAFGDYLNDIALLQSVTHSFAMENAHPELKAVSRYFAPSNDDDGVVRAIADFLKL